MKHIFAIIAVFIMSFSYGFAATGDTQTTLEEPTLSVENSYVYYWGNGCPHCATVNSYMKGVDLESKINLLKKEVWKDRDNAVAFSADVKRLGLKIEDTGVPFMIATENGKETVYSGSEQIIEHFKPLYGEPKPNKAKPIVLAILWLFVILVPAYLILGGKKK